MAKVNKPLESYNDNRANNINSILAQYPKLTEIKVYFKALLTSAKFDELTGNYNITLEKEDYDELKQLVKWFTT